MLGAVENNSGDDSEVQFDPELVADTKAAYPTRWTVEQKLLFWVKLGQATELLLQDRVGNPSGDVNYRNLPAGIMELFNDKWNDSISDRAENLDLAAEFEKTGQTYVILNDDGEIEVRNPPKVR